MRVEVRVEGFEEAIANLESLPGLLGEEGYGKASAAAARVFQREAKKAAPKSTFKYKSAKTRSGSLKRSIHRRGERARIPTRRGLKTIPNGYSVVFINFRRKIAPYAGIVLYGTDKSPTGSYRGKGRRIGGGRRGEGKLHVPGRGPKRGAPYTDFFNRAYDVAIAEMYEVAEDELRSAFDIVVRRLERGAFTRRDRGRILATRI